MIRNNNDGASQRNASAKRNVPGDGQMVQLNDIWNISESSQELLHFAEMIVAQLDQWCGWEHSLRGHDQGAASQTVQIRHNQQKIGSLFDWQKA